MIEWKFIKRCTLCLLLISYQAWSFNINLMTSGNSIIDIAVNGNLCLYSQAVNAFTKSVISSCNYEDGNFLEISVQPADTLQDLGFIAHFALTDNLGNLTCQS